MAGKANTEKVPLGILIVAAYSNDILKLGFKAIGLESNGQLFNDIEHNIHTFTPADVPWSHGLYMSVVWAVFAASIAYLFYKERRAAIIVGLVVISHWLLDFIVHPPELSLLFGNMYLYGLGLWTSTTGFRLAVIIELSMLAAGLALYLSAQRKRKLNQATDKPAVLKADDAIVTERSETETPTRE